MSSRTFRPPIPAALVRELAVEAETDPRTIISELLAPGSKKSMARTRARRVLARRGLIEQATYAQAPLALTHQAHGLRAGKL